MTEGLSPKRSYGNEPARFDTFQPERLDASHAAAGSARRASGAYSGVRTGPLPRAGLASVPAVVLQLDGRLSCGLRHLYRVPPASDAQGLRMPQMAGA